MKNIIDTIIGLATIVFCSKEDAQRLFKGKTLFEEAGYEFDTLNEWYQDEISGKSLVRYWAVEKLLDLYIAGGEKCFYENLEVGFAENEAFGEEYTKSVNVLNNTLRYISQNKIDLSKPEVYLYEDMLPADGDDRKYCEEVLKEFYASCERYEKKHAEEAEAAEEEEEEEEEARFTVLTRQRIFHLLPREAAVDYIKLHRENYLCIAAPKDYPEIIKMMLRGEY